MNTILCGVQLLTDSEQRNIFLSIPNANVWNLHLLSNICIFQAKLLLLSSGYNLQAAKVYESREKTSLPAPNMSITVLPRSYLPIV